MMKHQNLRRNLILSAGLLVVYTATFLIAMAVGRPVETLNFIATAGVAAGAALIFELAAVFLLCRHRAVCLCRAVFRHDV